MPDIPERFQKLISWRLRFMRAADDEAGATRAQLSDKLSGEERRRQRMNVLTVFAVVLAACVAAGLMKVAYALTVSLQGEGEATFNADSFSTYGIVTTSFRQDLRASDGHTYTITVDCASDRDLPRDATLQVSEIAEASRQYMRLMDRVSDTLPDEEQIGFARFFDITIESGGQEVQPSAPVSVSIELADELKATPATQLRLEHFEDQGATPQELPASLDGSGETSVVSFSTDALSVYGVVMTETIGVTAMTADGATYQISVAYGPEAKIPQGSTLEATEVLQEDEGYEAYLAGTADTLGVEADSIGQLRLFNITIRSRTGERVEPAAPVQVRIEYVDPIELNGLQSVQVIHFGDEATEVIEPGTNRGNDGSVDQIDFEAQSFSLYGIVSSGDTSNLDGKTLAIINTYTNNAVQDTKLNASKLMAAAVQISDGYVRANEDITFWTFNRVGSNSYTVRSDSGQYLNIVGTNNSGSVTVSGSAQTLTVTAGTGSHAGQIRLTNSSKIAVNNYSGSTAGGFGTYNDNGNNEWFGLFGLEEVQLNPAYAGEKVSVQDLQDAQQVIIYRSVFNEVSGSYEDYVVDGYGDLVKAYDKGDRLTLRSGVSPVWTLIMHRDETTQELNGYYDFYNEETGLYLSPQSTGSVVSATRPGVTLNGRRDGSYISTIEAWDTTAWAWYGYRFEVDEVGDATLQPATGAASQELLFAKYTTETTDELHAVRTVDSTAAGITIHMFNYPNRTTIANVTGSDSYAVNVLPGQHVGATLKNGYPTFKNGSSSGSTLFNPSGSYYQGDANNLFLESVFNSTGYYSYSCFNNFAHYDKGSGSFTVYQETGTPGNGDNFYLKRGNFFPFNDIDISRKATNTNSYNSSGERLDILDPTEGGTLYLINNPDYYFGMTVEATFMQAKGGHTDSGPVVYEFNGDDDLWVFIDGVLILDIGGVHDAWPGSINFATGEISGRGAGGATTIRDCFKNAGVFPDGSKWSDAKSDQYFSGNTFVDYGSHDFKMFYMEHGAGASNLELQFNLPVIEKGKFTVSKQLDDTAQAKFSNVAFAYQAFRKNARGNDVPLTNAVYEGTTNPVTFYPQVSINGKTYTNVFYLKPGEAATFGEIDETVEYYVQELGIGTDYYDEIIVNDVKIDGIDATARDGVYPTSVASVASRARVSFTNHCSEKNLNDLRITKALEEGSVDDGATFEFRVLLEGADGKLVPYSTGEYYLQNANGDYFHYVNGRLANNGKTPIVASVAGNNGTIAGVPAGYTVIIKNLLAETDFFVEEIRNPVGWAFAGKDVTAGSCDLSDMTGTGWAQDSVVADGQIKLDTDAEVTITNRGSQRLVAKKAWESGDFVSQHGEVSVALFAIDAAGKLTLVPDSVKTMSAPDWTVEYTLSGLSGYVVREVVVSGQTVAAIPEGGIVGVSGETTPFGSDQTDTYVASYELGEIRESGDADNALIREDTITNTLPRLRVNKTNLDGHPLAGATFQLLQDDRQTPVEGCERLVSTDSEEGNLIEGIYLSNGTYYLAELETPDGYNSLEHLVKIEVSAGAVAMTAMTDRDYAARVLDDRTADDVLLYTFNVANNPGVALPHTGGPGTVAYLASGALVALYAVACLLRKGLSRREES